MNEWPDDQQTARFICEAADQSGYEGERWGNMAHSLSLSLGLVRQIIHELAKLGYETTIAEPQGGEICRVQGEAVIVAVERTLDSRPCQLAYDLVVYCREEAMNPVIAKTLLPLVRSYGANDKAVMDQILETMP